MLQNKKYVFERPLLIITAAGIASIQLSGKSSVVLLPIMLIAVLLINLWFTVNRLTSTARIAAYIDIILEEKKYNWIGWERALRAWRIWNKKNAKCKQVRLKCYIDTNAIPSSMMYYPQIYWFHMITVIVAMIASFLLFIEPLNGSYSTWHLNSFGLDTSINFTINAVEKSSSNWYFNNLKLIAFIATIVSGGFFTYCSIKFYNPKSMRDLIETSRATWMAIFLNKN